MTERWYFTMDGETVVLRARFEGDGGMVGDAFDECHPGGDWGGLSYDELRAAGAGSVVVINERTEIEVGDA